MDLVTTVNALSTELDKRTREAASIVTKLNSLVGVLSGPPATPPTVPDAPAPGPGIVGQAAAKAAYLATMHDAINTAVDSLTGAVGAPEQPPAPQGS